MADIDTLKRVPLFSGLQSRHLKAIFKACTTRDYPAGEHLVEQGTQGIGLFIIESGKVQVTKERQDGSRIAIASHGPGEVIGEMAILDGAARSATVTALEACRCLVLPSWSFQSIMEAHPEVALGILPVIVKRFRETNDALLASSAEKSGF